MSTAGVKPTTLHEVAVKSLEFLERKLVKSVRGGHCAKCWFELPFCYCNQYRTDMLQKVFPHTRVIVLMDPNELKRSISSTTGKILWMWGGERVMFGHDEQMEYLYKRIREAKRPVCLYPARDAVVLPEFGNVEKCSIDASGDASVAPGMSSSTAKMPAKTAGGTEKADGSSASTSTVVDSEGQAFPDLVIIPDGDWRRCKVMIRRIPETVQMWKLNMDVNLYDFHSQSEARNPEARSSDSEFRGRNAKPYASHEGGIVPPASEAKVSTPPRAASSSATQDGDKSMIDDDEKESSLLESRTSQPAVGSVPGDDSLRSTYDSVFGRTKKYKRVDSPCDRIQTAGAFWLMCKQSRAVGNADLLDMQGQIKGMVDNYYKQINRVIKS